MTGSLFSYTLDNVSVRSARQTELEAMYMARVTAMKQKDEMVAPPSLNILHQEYSGFEAENMQHQWNADGAYFMIANIPEQDASVFIPDENGNAVAGFCSIIYDPQNNPEIFQMGNLFTIGSNHPVGRVLLSNCIDIARQTDAQSILINAPLERSAKWYEENALFETLEGQGSILSSHFNMMELMRDNFDEAQKRLQDFSRSRLAKPIANGE